MTENIIQSFISQMEMVEAKVAGSNQAQKTFAEGLASAVIEVALREVCRGRNVEGFQSSRLTGAKMDDGQAENQSFLNAYGKERDILNMGTETDPELQPSNDTQPDHPPLSQSGLPIVGSLDYPDAPPTTPLLPELERSRHSFARKLKGGLANVFLPSPPPPTPKENDDEPDCVIKDAQVELMEHLMQSLSTDDVARNYFEVSPQLEAKIEDFAEVLSCNIIEWVLSTKGKEQIADDSDLHLLAQQLAQSIITSSLDEAKLLV
uniref:uncharacterized protein LOC109971360 n=1 Tax=Monopterus albus TaxID=43700 RepID=UPI0009B30CDB|nr:uncharacterized protein LOC109971360 [Monopterus albus]